jgi:hypothetical protein
MSTPTYARRLMMIRTRAPGLDRAAAVLEPVIAMRCPATAKGIDLTGGRGDVATTV